MDALGLLTVEMTKRIVTNVAQLNAPDKCQPNSHIICLDAVSDDFQKKEIRIVSDSVAEEIAKRFLKDVWNDMVFKENNANSGMIFETFMRKMLTEPKFCLDAKLNIPDKIKRKGVVPFQLVLGGCTVSRLVSDLRSSVRNGPDNVLYYSTNQYAPLVDMVYKRGMFYYAIQATIVKEHKANVELIQQLEKDLQLDTDNKMLLLIYAVPDARFDGFKLKPVDPLEFEKYIGREKSLPKTVVLHAKIENPNIDREQPKEDKRKTQDINHKKLNEEYRKLRKKCVRK